MRPEFFDIFATFTGVKKNFIFFFIAYTERDLFLYFQRELNHFSSTDQHACVCDVAGFRSIKWWSCSQYYIITNRRRQLSRDTSIAHAVSGRSSLVYFSAAALKLTQVECSYCTALLYVYWPQEHESNASDTVAYPNLRLCLPCLCMEAPSASASAKRHASLAPHCRAPRREHEP